ncbi:MAG: molybdopterin cofactor-binding domain-containing protein [Chloroflexota bacterium]|nr:molybdopterin cofactor-binding domain-containing protein [Chloroflexota bacterium]
MENEIHIVVNDKVVPVDRKFMDWPLVRFLREELRLTGTKQGCDSKGTCGLCKVIINGKARISCVRKMSSLDGAIIETIENLAINGGMPHPLIQTVIQDGIFQCGFCASGAILSAKALLDKTLNPSDKEIERAISGILCRCVGLNRMDQSIKRAAGILRGDIERTWTEEDTANEYMTIEKLTGKKIYTDDLRFDGMLIAKAVRANMPHGKVKSVDISNAEKMPGIVKILTSKDIPGKNIFGLVVPDQQVFCDDVVRYLGDTLALVIGETIREVEEAIKAVDVEIEPLPVVATIEDALKADAPVLHRRLGDISPDMPNVLKHFHIRKGDPQEGFAKADLIYEQSYHVPFVEHAYMEPETSIGVSEDDGTVKIFVGSQGPVEDRAQVAQVLGIDEALVQIAHMYMGGGFGGKEDIAGQIHAALATFHTGRPVKVHWSREESIAVSYKRHAADLYYKMGMTKEGKLVAADVKVYGDTGAYASAGETVLFRMMAFACGPYEIPNVEVNTYAVHTNNNPSGAFRGYGSPQVAFAAETHLQYMIEALGLDPIEARLQNALDYGKATITGDVLTEDVGAGMVQCIQAVKRELAKTKMPQVEKNEKLGVGIACAYKNVGLGISVPDRSGAQVSLERDGKFLVRHGGTDMGQGSNQVVATIASRVLGVPLKDIRVHTGDTREDPHGGITTASRATFVTGNAAKKAAEGLREVLWEAVSTEFGAPVDVLKIQNGVFINTKRGKEIITLKTLAAGPTQFKWSTDYEAPQTQAPFELIPAYPDVPDAPLHFAYDFGAQAAILSVNLETGETKVHKIIAAHDSGEPIIYKNVIGQIEGAVVQGLGYALSENFAIEDGIPKTTRLRDLGLLRFRDIPEIIAIPITDPHPKGPFGAKGMGELALSPTAPAVINAIHDATGVWLRELPATQERVKRALEEKEGNIDK